MRYLKLFIFISFSIATTSFLFTNCGQQTLVTGNTSNEGNQLVTTQPTSSIETSSRASNNQNPFAEQKLQFDIESAAAASSSSGETLLAQKLGLRTKTGETLIPAGTQLIVVLNNQCQQEGSNLYNFLRSNQDSLDIEFQNYIWQLEQDTTLEAIRNLADSDPCIRGIANDGVLKAEGSTDTLYNYQTGIRSVGHTDASAFFDLANIGAVTDVKVAVIDSGVNYNHLDLTDNILRNSSNAIVGYDYRNGDSDPMDDFGHGTAVAGILGAKSNNGIGVTGTMGHNIKIMPIKVQDNTGVGYISDIVRGIDFAIANKADVINISMAGETTSTSLLDAMQRAVAANIVVVVAAGNSGVEISSLRVIIPAYYAGGVTGAIAVGSNDSGTSNRSAFSNYSTTYVKLFAPGNGGIYYPCLQGTTNCTSANAYGSGQGTSYASPIVAGAAALAISTLKTHGISYTPASIESLLLMTATTESSLTPYGKSGALLSLKRLAHLLKTSYVNGSSGGLDDF